MSNDIEITFEEAYVKFPFLKKLDKEDMATLMSSILLTVLLGPKGGDTLMHALKVVITKD